MRILNICLRQFSILLLCFSCFGTLFLLISNFKTDEWNVDAPKILKARLQGPLRSDDPSVLEYIAREVLVPPSTKPYNLPVIFKNYETQLTWRFINNILVKLFDDQPAGFYVEAGAYDGQILSNSLWLEREKKWNGLLVEPDASNFASLKNKNRKAWTSFSCLSTSPYPKTATMVGFSHIYMNGEDIENKIGTHLRRSTSYDVENGIDIHERRGDIYHKSYKTFNIIQCFPLQSFLLALNVTVVDFLSLDMQGGEWEVLKNWPWEKLIIRTLVVEYIISETEKTIIDPAFVTFMETKGYHLIGTSYEPDYFFILKNDKLFTKVSNLPLTSHNANTVVPTFSN